MQKTAEILMWPQYSISISGLTQLPGEVNSYLVSEVEHLEMVELVVYGETEAQKS